MEDNQCRYDIQGLAEDLEVELGDIVELYANYFDEMKSEISEMKKFLSDCNWLMLERVVHNIKGVSANLSMHDIYNESAAFDTLLKINVTDGAAYYISKIEELLNVAENEVAFFFLQHGLAL